MDIPLISIPLIDILSNVKQKYRGNADGRGRKQKA